jgi:hypothetical protein
MPSPTQAQPKAADTTWNYADVIALVTAYLPGNTFNGDRGAWLRGISELVEEYPSFFRQVHFIRRDPLPPYSARVDEVLKMLGKWEYQGSFNPRYRTWEVAQDAKTELRALMERKFTPDQLEKIHGMSEILAGHVSWKPEERGDVESSGGSTGRD